MVAVVLLDGLVVTVVMVAAVASMREALKPDENVGQ